MKSTDRNIILNLYKNTKSNKYAWNRDFYKEDLYYIWKKYQKISENKIIIYEVKYDRKIIGNSYLKIYMFNKQNKKEIEIKKINNLKYIMMLIKSILKYNNFKCKEFTLGLMDSSFDESLILLIKKNIKNTYWSIPGDKFDNFIGSKSDFIDEYFKNNLNVKILDKFEINLKFIFYVKDTYYYINLFIINKYEFDYYHNKNIKKLDWVNINDIYNFYIDYQSLKILEYIFINMAL